MKLYVIIFLSILITSCAVGTTTNTPTVGLSEYPTDGIYYEYDTKSGTTIIMDIESGDASFSVGNTRGNIYSNGMILLKKSTCFVGNNKLKLYNCSFSNDTLIGTADTYYGPFTINLVKE